MKKGKEFITFQNVSIRLQEKVLFRNLNWKIKSDEHWAVIGPNASGKTALLKAIYGLLPVVKGELIYHFLFDKESPQEEIAYVTFDSQRRVLGMEAFYQERWNPSLNEDKTTVSDYLEEKDVKRVSRFHVVETYAGKDFQKRRYRVVRLLGIQKLLTKKVVELSNGERRKVTLARALLKEPKLLILDNPLAGLDADFKNKFIKILENLINEKMHLIVALTNRDLIPKGITHVLALNDFKVAQKTTRKEFMNVAYRKRSSAISNMSPRSKKLKGGSRESVVEMKNVNVSYNYHPILQNIDWIVKKGQKWALLGPNGAGKTTLLSLILSDNPQVYANEVKIFGRRRGEGESIWQMKRQIGWVSPELQLYYPREASVVDVACSGWFDSIGLFEKCTGEKRKVAIKWLKKFDLDRRASNLFSRLSEGEQRLALLARAMVKDPQLLILDEPCQGLDASHKDRFLSAVDAVCSNGDKTLIYVTHRRDEFPRCITHVLKLESGRVFEQGRKNN